MNLNISHQIFPWPNILSCYSHSFILYWLIFYIFLRNFRRNIWDKVNTHKTIEKLTSEKFLWHFYSQKRLVDWIEWLILILSSFNNHFHSQQQKICSYSTNIQKFLNQNTFTGHTNDKFSEKCIKLSEFLLETRTNVCQWGKKNYLVYPLN